MDKLNPDDFSSKKELKEFVAAFLKNAVEKNFGQFTDLETAFLHLLLARHPEAKEKMGCGILRFFVTRNFGGRPHLEFMRKDGSRDSVSWVTCVSGISQNLKARIVAALRNEIREDIVLAKELAIKNGDKCECGLIFLDFSQFEMDHINSFKLIVDRFMSYYSYTLDLEKRSGGLEFLKDRQFANLWQVFHMTNSVLKPLCKSCHKLKTKFDRLESLK